MQRLNKQNERAEGFTYDVCQGLGIENGPGYVSEET
jgi:hypothetical protein